MSYVPGLEGVVVGETAISNVEGEVGRLSYRGVSIEDIVAMEYLDVAYLLLFGNVPTDMDRENFSKFVSIHGRLTLRDLNMVKLISTELHPMKALQAMIPLLTLSQTAQLEVGGTLIDVDCNEGLQIIAKFPALIAAIRSTRSSTADAERYREDLDYLAGFMLMYTGSVPQESSMEVLKVVQLLQMDHSFNAGTFASRVISSTMASVPAVLSGAVGALSGSLHGGADEAALRVARRVGSPQAAELFVDELLAKQGRLMGMGHREYRVVDPRSVILKPMAEKLCRQTAFENDYLTLLAIEEVFNRRMAEKGKQVWANVEYYKGIVLETLGVEPAFFTTMFAMARSVGWLAHFMESRLNNKIIRPAAKYVGPAVSAA